MMQKILRNTDRPWRLVLATSALVLLSGTANAQVSVYHSANNDGTNTGVNVPGSTTHPLNLYMTKGNTESGGQLCEAGSGDEICGWIFELDTVGNFSFVDFTPEPGVDLVFKLTANNFDAQGTDALAPTPGIHRIGTLNIHTQGFGGSIQLTSGQAVAHLSIRFDADRNGHTTLR